MTRPSEQTLEQAGILCQYFALCTRPAAGVVSHPVLGYVPTCSQCADVHDLDLTPATIVVEDGPNDSCCDNNGTVG